MNVSGVNQSGINQVLAQMRAMESTVSKAEEVLSSKETEKNSFGDILSESINQVNDSQMKARELSEAFSAGAPGVDLPEVMVAMQESSVSFEAVKQVRNKLLSAYQEVMSMPV